MWLNENKAPSTGHLSEPTWNYKHEYLLSVMPSRSKHNALMSAQTRMRLKWAQTSVYESIFLLRRSLLKLWGPQGDSRLKNYLFCALLISSTKRKSRGWIFQCRESNRCQLQGPLLIKMNHVEGSEFQKQAEIQDLYLQTHEIIKIDNLSFNSNFQGLKSFGLMSSAGWEGHDLLSFSASLIACCYLLFLVWHQTLYIYQNHCFEPPRSNI